MKIVFNYLKCRADYIVERAYKHVIDYIESDKSDEDEVKAILDKEEVTLFSLVSYVFDAITADSVELNRFSDALEIMTREYRSDFIDMIKLSVLRAVIDSLKLVPASDVEKLAYETLLITYVLEQLELPTLEEVKEYYFIGFDEDVD